MISMSCDHPDIEEFIEVKSDLDRVTKANISVRITDKFMEAVEDNEEHELSFTRPETGETVTKIVNARSILRKLAEMNWSHAEPGALFWDKISQWNMLSNTKEFEFAGTNPCGSVCLM